MTRIAYLVLVVEDLERALAVWEVGLGFYRIAEPTWVPALGAKQVLLRAENAVIEILEPHDDSRPPGLFLRERGEGVFAVAARLPHPEQAAVRLANLGAEPVGGLDATTGGSRWYVRPANAQGILVDVGGPDLPDPI
jgi:hypothetical protein